MSRILPLFLMAVAMHGGMSAASAVAKEHAAKATQAAVAVPALLHPRPMAVIPSQASAGTVVKETGQPQKEHINNIKKVP